MNGLLSDVSKEMMMTGVIYSTLFSDVSRPADQEGVWSFCRLSFTSAFSCLPCPLSSSGCHRPGILLRTADFQCNEKLTSDLEHRAVCVLYKIQSNTSLPLLGSVAYWFASSTLEQLGVHEHNIYHPGSRRGVICPTPSGDTLPTAVWAWNSLHLEIIM